MAQDARDKGYKVKTPELFVDKINGKALAYYQHASNRIVVHDHFVESTEYEDLEQCKELEQTLLHELSHAIAEQNNTDNLGVTRMKCIFCNREMNNTKYKLCNRCIKDQGTTAYEYEDDNTTPEELFSSFVKAAEEEKQEVKS